MRHAPDGFQVRPNQGHLVPVLRGARPRHYDAQDRVSLGGSISSVQDRLAEQIPDSANSPVCEDLGAANSSQHVRPDDAGRRYDYRHVPPQRSTVAAVFLFCRRTVGVSVPESNKPAVEPRNRDVSSLESRLAPVSERHRLPCDGVTHHRFDVAVGEGAAGIAPSFPEIHDHDGGSWAVVMSAASSSQRQPFQQSLNDVAKGFQPDIPAHRPRLLFRVEPAQAAKHVRLDSRKQPAPVVSLRHEHGAFRWTETDTKRGDLCLVTSR